MQSVGVFLCDFTAVFELGLLAWFVVFDFGRLCTGWGGGAGAIFHLLEAVAEAHCDRGGWVMCWDASGRIWSEDDRSRVGAMSAHCWYICVSMTVTCVLRVNFKGSKQANQAGVVALRKMSRSGDRTWLAYQRTFVD